MPEPRKKMFGPLLYSTLALTLVVSLFSGFEVVRPRFHEWQEIRALAESLHSPSEPVRNSAAGTLLRKGVEVAEPYFLEATRAPRAEVRALACRSLVDLGSYPIVTMPILVASANDPDPSVRVEAARGLGRVAQTWSRPGPSKPGTPDLAPEGRLAGLEALRKLIKDRSLEVRVAAIEWTIPYGPEPSMLGELARATNDPERPVQLAASKALIALKEFGDPAASRRLLEIVSEREVTGDRLMALEILKEAGDEARNQAITALVGLLESTQDDAVRRDVAECLMISGPWAAPALPALDRIFGEADSEYRAVVGLAIVAIEGQNNPKTVSILVRVVDDPSIPQERRQLALDGLNNVSPAELTKATPDLIRQLGDPNPNIRQAAMDLMNQIIPVAPAEMPGPVPGK